MANIKSQIKRNRQNEKRRLRNRFFRGVARSAVKKARAALETGGMEESRATVLAAISALDKAAERGIIHRNNAARRKERLMRRLALLEKQPGKQQQPQAEEATAAEAGARPKKTRRKTAK